MPGRDWTLDGQTPGICEICRFGEYPEKGAAGQPVEGAGAALKGVQVQNLTPDMELQLGLPSSTAGVVVTQVDPSSAAAAAGIQHGDVIQEVDRKPVRDVEQYQQALQSAGNQAIVLLLNRGGTTLFVVVQPQG